MLAQKLKKEGMKMFDQRYYFLQDGDTVLRGCEVYKGGTFLYDGVSFIGDGGEWVQVSDDVDEVDYHAEIMLPIRQPLYSETDQYDVRYLYIDYEWGGMVRTISSNVTYIEAMHSVERYKATHQEEVGNSFFIVPHIGKV
jgi:hypothetical protein